MEGESEQLSQLEQVFRQPDAVMEPNIFDTLCQYVAAHGKPRTAIELLCENYVGASMRLTCIRSLWAVSSSLQHAHTDMPPLHLHRLRADGQLGLRLADAD